MRRTFLYLSVMALLVIAGVAGCVTTTLQTDWRNPDFQGTFKRVIVICRAQEQIVRETLEDDIAAQFAARGVSAVPSYSYFPSLSGIDRQAVVAKVKEIKADGVFLVQPVGKSTLETDLNVEGPEWSDRLGPVVFAESSIDVYRIETSLYETERGKAVWRALSDTMAAGSWLETLKGFARIMVAKLAERGLI